MRSIKLFPLLWCCACNPFAHDSNAGSAASATQTGGQTQAPAQATAAASHSSAGGTGAPATRFPIMSMIIPPSMPFTGAAMTSGTSGMTGTNGMTGTGTSAAGAGAAGPSAGAGADQNPFDPATFDEAHGRSRGTAPLGTPVEPGGMQCPNEVCKPLPALPDQATAMGAMLSLCCTDEGECGTKGSGPMSMGDPNECHIIPDSDPQCARLDLMGFEIASCCTADGKCGLNGQNFMMKPCGSIEDAMQMFGSFIDLPAPAPCEPGKGPPHSSSALAPGVPAPDMMAGAAGATMPAAGSGAAGGGAPTMAGAAGTSVSTAMTMMMMMSGAAGATGASVGATAGAGGGAP